MTRSRCSRRPAPSEPASLRSAGLTGPTHKQTTPGADGALSHRPLSRPADLSTDAATEPHESSSEVRPQPAEFLQLDESPRSGPQFSALQRPGMSMRNKHRI